MNLPLLVVERAPVIVNNILSEIIKTTDFDSNEVYLDWLEAEVGMTKDDIKAYKDAGLLPMPY